MKRTLFLLISLYMGLMGANAQSNKYDLNDDGDVNVIDVTLLVSKILAQNEESGYDLNDDEDVNITDVILLVNYILGKDNGLGDTSQAYLTCPDDNHPHLIDLGLPSGTKWACCNVGSYKPEQYGGHFAWGETEVKNYYDWNTYIYCDSTKNTCHDFGSDISGTQYDVAHVKWGGKWCMPTSDDIKELYDNTTHKELRTMLNGVMGMKFTSKNNGNSIFLPHAGLFRDDNGDLHHAEIYGYYWSSTHRPKYSYCADALDFTSTGGYCTIGYIWRCKGLSVRPVWKE